MARAPGSRRFTGFVLSTSTLAMLACGSSGSDGGGTPPPAGPPDVSTPTISTGSTSEVVLPKTSVDATGGAIAITDPGSPLQGLSIVVPQGATDEEIAFKVSHADVTGVTGLPDGSRVVGKLITIEATGSESWNEGRLFNQPIRVTLPYPAPAQPDDVLNVYSVEPDGTLEATGYSEQDETARTISFYTRSFASTAFDPSAPAGASPLLRGAGSRAINTAADAQTTFARYIQVFKDNAKVWTTTPSSLPTSFRPTVNGWYIPNKGSFLTSEGNCFGMSSFAKWYFKKGFAPALISNYRDPVPTPTWIDDAVAIQLAARIQADATEVLSRYINFEAQVQQSAKRVVAGILGALYDTKSPVLLSLGRYGELDGKLQRVGSHAVLIWQADVDPATVTFRIYDPNKPGVDGVPLVYTRGVGFQDYNPYNNKDRIYTEFRMAYFAMGLSGAQMLHLKKLADAGFKNDTWFPKVTIDSITAKNKGETVYDRATSQAQEDKTADGLHKYITTDKVVVLRGSVRGPKVQDGHCVDHNGKQVSCVVDQGYVIYHGSQTVAFNINNKADGSGDGTFQVEVPLAQGENQFAIVAAKLGWKAWAGFLEDIIESRTSHTNVTVTLSWDAAATDLDLYVQEPDQPAPGSKKGDTVYWRHRRDVDILHPYLDVDQTRGPGIEHYLGDEDTVTQYTDGTDAQGPYGIYTVRGHYYADNSGKQAPQQAPFTIRWRYLAFCPELPNPCADPETTGSWIESTVSGSLSGPDNSNCCDITGSGPNWSPSFAFNYEQPDPNRWKFPASTRVMGP